MAKRYDVVLVDDLDPTLANAETIRITRDGETREIDLAKRNINKYIKRVWDEGRRVDGGTKAAAKEDRPKLSALPNTTGVDNAKIREWARSHGVPVPERGRVPKAVVEQYEDFESRKFVVG